MEAYPRAFAERLKALVQQEVYWVAAQARQRGDDADAAFCRMDELRRRFPAGQTGETGLDEPTCKQLQDMALSAGAFKLCELLGFEGTQACEEDFRRASEPRPAVVSAELWQHTKQLFLAAAHVGCAEALGHDPAAALAELEGRLRRTGCDAFWTPAVGWPPARLLPPPWEEKRRLLESARRARLSRLGVSAEAIDQSELSPLPPQADSDTFRVMQYNVLAQGLSDDGFLVRPVLAEWPAGPGSVPTAGGGAEAFSGLLKEMLGARGDASALDRLKVKYDMPSARCNFEAIVDAEARLLQLQLQVVAASPDILFVQELDRYGEFMLAMEELGYTSKLPGVNGPYVPAHVEGSGDALEDEAAAFCRSREAQGYAFLPHLGSNALHLTMLALGADEKIIAAAASSGLRDRVVDERGHLSRTWWQGLPGGSGPLLEAAGVSPTSVDDMGVAVFWRADRFVAEDLRIRVYDRGGGGTVQVRLRECGQSGRPGRTLVAMCTHLSSGDSPEDEERRLELQVDPERGLCARATEAVGAGLPLVLAMDANSHPQIVASRGGATREGHSSCWRALRGAVGASVWDSYFDPMGVPLGGCPLDPPVTSNKVRGPLSGQAKKIGLHAYYLIDHIFFNPTALQLRGHACAPRRFPSADDALEAVQPSLANPSDHYPVVVDLAWVP